MRTDHGRILAILAYHKVGAPPPGSWETWYSVPTPTFERQLRNLVEHGWEAVDVATALDGLSHPERLPPRSVLITFDDAFASLAGDARMSLAGFGFPAAVFVPTDYVGDWNRFDANTDLPREPICDWSTLRRLDRAAVSVQSHGVSHRPFSELDPETQRDELRRSKKVLEAELGKPVEVFSFPYGDQGTESHALDRELERAGYRAACLYGRGVNRLPVEEPYRLARIAMGPDTDLEVELEAAESRQLP
jgi:peptidoglycan/xylan/chitin deacetylase (PgdA/CDA1 family)